MCHGIEAAGDRHGKRQPGGQVRVIDHDLGQDAVAAHRCLAASFRLAKDRRHLGPGIGGRNDDLRQVCTVGNCLAKPGRGAAAERDDAIRAGRPYTFHGRFGDIDGRVHRRFCKDADGDTPKLFSKLCGIVRLMRC